MPKLHHVGNCGVPGPPENGTIVNYTSTVEVQLYSTSECSPGFGPVGEITAVCAVNGGWNPVPADVTCGEVRIVQLSHRLQPDRQYHQDVSS